MTVSAKRPVHVALVSLALSVIFFGIAFFLGRWSGFAAITAIGWMNLSVALIWLVLSLQFHQRALAEQEKLDASQLVKDKGTSTIFQAGSERATLFDAAQRRLEIFEKWFIPIFAGLIAVYQVAIGLYLLSAAEGAVETELKQPLLCCICMVAIAFVSFLISRYATGMSREPVWKPLRAGGSSLLGVAVLCFVLAVALAATYLFKRLWPVNVLALVVPGLLVVLGVETALNIVLDIYRPRLKGRYSRSAFDSRLLGTINEPGGILRSVADAIDYQFGFQVSQTWFYKLLEQAIVPLALFAVVTLYLLSCIVVVEPGEQAVIEHFGSPADDANDVRLVGPGLRVKWPWPVDVVYRYPTERISQISIGFVPEIDPNGQVAHKPLLWGEGHHKAEYKLLVANEQGPTESGAGTVPVSIVIAAVPVQYRINDLYSFVYNHQEPERLLESICYRELTKFAASAKIEVEQETDTEQSLIGMGRAQAGKTLTERIQAAAKEAKLGVEIVFVGLQGVHPPVEVAADYQKVIGAFQTKQRLILEAKAERNRILGMLVGSVEKAEALYDLALKYQQAEESGSPAEIEEIGKQLDRAFEQAKGVIFKTLRDAQNHAFKKEVLAEATGLQFAGQLDAYKAAPEIYVHEQWLAMLEALGDIRKYVVVAGPNDTQVTIIDFQEKLMPNLMDYLGGLEENSQP
ncbi:protease modulator HflK [Planctomycetota bacterium]